MVEACPGEAMSPMMSVKPPLRVALVGRFGSGKTTTLLRLKDALLAAGLSAGGVLQPARREGDRVMGYDLLDVATRERRPFASLVSIRRPGCPGFLFSEEGWGWARRLIIEARQQAQVLLLDELGRVEADEGSGHLPALLEPVASEKAGSYLLGVRADRADAIEARLGGFDLTCNLPLDEELFTGLLQRVLDRVSGG